MHRRNAIEVVTGLVVLIVAIGFLGYAISRSGTGAPSGGYTLYADFNSIAGLGVGSDVRLAGVKVGSVASETVDPKTYLARVAMSIEPGLRIPRDSGVTVASESLLGGEYLSISPGGDEQMLQPGQSFTTTQGAISLQDLLGKFIFSATNMVSAMTSSAGKAGGPPAAGSAAGSGGAASDAPGGPLK
ncbi:MAG TPA: outer membrane lipid asymmetry maintenance protein MlaD [Acetobacteraceae bacterium]|nr:outer membrane lipid asymmetry maintenance protein MlaD [Acetobacteraceae bacterium]